MTYEYKCKNCDHHWEIEQKIIDDAITKCPICQMESAERLISRCAFVLKGGGWFNSGGY